MAEPAAGYRGRPASRSLGTRMTVLEVEMSHFGRRFDEHLTASDRNHAEMVALIRKLDSRADEQDGRSDRQDVAQARLLGGVGVLVFLGSLFGPILAPAIARALGIPS